jgi:hypothetical protein
MFVKSIEHFRRNENGNESSLDPLKNRMERRRWMRTRLHWHVQFFGLAETGSVETTTQNLSSRGFYCTSPLPCAPGERFTCTIKVPAHQPDGSDRILSLECHVRILRVDKADADGTYGLACEIEEYQFLRSNNAASA